MFSFIGWACEVIYCSVLSKKLVNRGFLAGPVCPVYGFGALLVIWLLSPVQANIPVIFLCGMVITSALEYITGWLLEVFFSTKWWDYSNRRFNLEGRVCLMNSVLFGILCVILMRGIYPLALYLVGLIPEFWIGVTSTALTAIFAVDIAITVNTMINMNERLKKLHEFTEELKNSRDLHEWFNESEFYKSFERLKLIAEESKSELSLMLRGNFEMLTSKKGSGLRLMKAFPNMKSIKYDVQLNHLKEVLRELKLKAKKQTEEKININK
jgi:uncharacterized membrane protein